MISVSNEYKEIMNRPIRNRIFISVGIGIINQDAQESGTASTESKAYWSYGNIFNTNQEKIEYATLEENFCKVDGSMYFIPENDEFMQLKNNGITTEDVLSAIRIDFPQIYAIKGITLNFGSAHPTEFTIETSEKTLSYTNDLEVFETTDVLGDTDHIIITPIAMVGGQQRFRLKSVLMGVGLQYSNEQTKDFNLNEYVSSISEELPNESINYSFYDEENRFDVDNESSFMDYLETMQKMTISFGLELDNGNVEWHQIATQFLEKWKSQKGIVSLAATDRLSQMEDTYSLGNKIYTRTAYEEAESIFADAGLEPDEYFIDDYLQDITLTNPMPEAMHKECLQLLANACRCIIRQDENGRIIIRANFANILDTDDLIVETNGVADWSKPQNILIGTSVVYSDLTKNFFKTDGTMYFLPEDEDYLETSYVSEQISDENGLFEKNPMITIILPASYSYYGVNINFDGNTPQEMIIHTYKSDLLQESIKFADLVQESYLLHEFKSFDKMVFEITKGYPNNRVLINKISFGDLSDYVLIRNNMMENPIGYKEKRVKATRVKVFTFTGNKDGTYQEVEDSVYVTKVINTIGEIKTLENPLISTQEQAELLAEWIGNYYANNVSYDVEYRGEPRLSSVDIIRMEYETKDSLKVEVASHKLNFTSGKLSGSLEFRRALRMIGV